MTTNVVTDEQFGLYCKRQRDLEGRILKGSVPFDLAMNGTQAIIEHNRPRLVDLVGPIYPKGTIALSIDIDLTLSLEEMIRRGRYANEAWALKNITEDRFLIVRNVPEPRYSTTVLLVPPYRDMISFQDQGAEMEVNRLNQLGIVETLAIGAQCPHLQQAYDILGIGSSWCSNLYSPAVRRYDGEPWLDLFWRNPTFILDANARCVASPQEFQKAA